MSKPPPSSTHQSADVDQEQRKNDAPDQPHSKRQREGNPSEDHNGAQPGQPGAQRDDVHGGNPSQGYGTQMSGGTQSGQQSGSYSSDSGRGDRRGTRDNGEREASDAPQNVQSDQMANRSDQDFGQQPAFGGYGPDGGGYGSQTNYASHNTYRSAGDPDLTQRQGAGTTSSHTGTGTRTEGQATGASEGATFGGATTELTNDALDGGSDHRGDGTASRGPGAADALAGRSVSSSSTTKPSRD